MASSSSQMSNQEAREMLELKKKAIEYYKENGVPEKMEEILNSAFYDKPDDVYGHLANYFESFAAVPKITKILSREALDSKGQSAIQTEIHCCVKNREQLISCTLSSNVCSSPDSVKPEEREAFEEERQKSVTEAVHLLNSCAHESLKDSDPTQQQAMDTLIMNIFEKIKSEEEERLTKKKEEEKEELGDQEPEAEPVKSSRSSDSKSKGAKSPKGKGKGPAVVITPDEPQEAFFCGCNLISAMSQATAVAGASLKREPLYKHIASMRYDEIPEKIHVPLPMVTIFTSGKQAPGKLNSVKEFMVVPKPGMAIKESLKHIVGIYNHCAKTVSAKTGVTAKAVNDLGALWATFDRPEQGLDLLQEAITQLGLTPGEDFHIALNCAGHEIFDYEKGKYEVVTGQQKTADDLSDYWGDLLGRYPAIIALVDPIRKVETEAWMKLAERVSERCYIAGDAVYHRPGLLVEEELNPELKTSAIILRLEQMNSVTDVLKVTKKLEDADNQIIIGTGLGETTDSFVADLAVGCGARFLKVGAPCRGERVSKLNRLLQIEAALEAVDKLEPLEAHRFPIVKPPTPTPTPSPSEEQGGEAESNSVEKND